MIKRPKPERFRLRRTMMFMNAQKPGLIKDAYIYGCDSIMLDLEDAVAENQKDAARFSLYHALTTIDYGNTEVIVRINGLDTPHWQEDIRVCVAGGADGIRIAKCESAQDVKTVEEHVAAAEREFGVEVGRTLLMAALESPKGIMNAYEICTASDRMLGCAISGGDFRKCMQTKFQKDGIDMLVARGQMLMAARAAGVRALIRCSPISTITRALKPKSARTRRWALTARASSTRSRFVWFTRFSPRPRRKSRRRKRWSARSARLRPPVSACSRSTERWLTSPLFRAQSAR